jgi:hypothetical protein
MHRLNRKENRTIQKRPLKMQTVTTIEQELLPASNPIVVEALNDIEKELEKIERAEAKQVTKMLSFGESLEEDEPIIIPNNDFWEEQLNEIVQIRADKLFKDGKWKQKYPFKVLLRGSARYWNSPKIIVRGGNPIIVTIFCSGISLEKGLKDLVESLVGTEDDRRGLVERFPLHFRQTAIALWDPEQHKRTKKLTLEQWETAHMTYLNGDAEYEVSGKIKVTMKHRKTGIVCSMTGDIKDEPIMQKYLRLELSRKVFEAEHRQEIEAYKIMGIIES